MNYLWEVVLQADREQIPVSRIDFIHAQQSSAYMELALPFLNEDGLGGRTKIEVNTYYRFYSIFCEMFGPEQKEFPDFRRSLANVILHMLAENDVRRGMTKEAYYRKLIAADIWEERFGHEACIVFAELAKEEQEILLNGILRNYQVGNALAIFTDMVYGLLREGIVYHNNDCPDEVLVYIGEKRTRGLERKLNVLSDLFLDISYHVEIFYEYHFGIVGVDSTMQIDEIAIY